jgi:hypothetical protein
VFEWTEYELKREHSGVVSEICRSSTVFRSPRKIATAQLDRHTPEEVLAEIHLADGQARLAIKALRLKQNRVGRAACVRSLGASRLLMRG